MMKRITALALRTLLLLTIFMGLAKQIRMALLSWGDITAKHEEPGHRYLILKDKIKEGSLDLSKTKNPSETYYEIQYAVAPILMEPNAARPKRADAAP